MVCFLDQKFSRSAASGLRSRFDLSHSEMDELMGAGDGSLPPSSLQNANPMHPPGSVKRLISKFQSHAWCDVVGEALMTPHCMALLAYLISWLSACLHALCRVTVQLFDIGAVAVSVKVSNLKSYSNLNEKALCL